MGHVTDRSSADPFGNTLYDATKAADKAVVEKVASIAAARGITRAQVALAWLLRNPVISAPIVGAGKPGHLEDALAALDVSLTDEEVSELEAPYIPHPAMGIAF